MVDDLKMIRKHYGEKMMHLCRDLFSTILETPGLLYSLMEANFAPNHFLYDDIIIDEHELDFKDYIYSMIKVSMEKHKSNKTPFELLDEAGYVLYECKSEDDIQKFKKYYADGEELCTFNGGRLDSCYVFFAVKKNVDEICRENFSKPERQDEYGTSVISIQFSKGNCNSLSIKNRYNHKVSNPDATFYNDLDCIISGLTDSFEKEYDLRVVQNDSSNFELPGYVRANDGRYYKYNFEINNVYYCPGNIIIDNFKVVRDYQEKEKYIIADYFIIDLVKKEVRLYDGSIEDSFIDGFKDIKKIEVSKSSEKGTKSIRIMPNEGYEIVIEIDAFNNIIGYRNDNLIEIGDNFLNENRSLYWLELLNVRNIGNKFLKYNKWGQKFYMPNLLSVGDEFLPTNRRLKKLDLPKLEFVGDEFLTGNSWLVTLNLPSLISVGDKFLFYNRSLKELELPNLMSVGNAFLSKNQILTVLKLPKLVTAGDYFLNSNIALIDYDLSSLSLVMDDFMFWNKGLKTLNLPNLVSVGSCFLFNNDSLKEIDLPNLRKVFDDFLYKCSSLEVINLPLLDEFGDGFLFQYELRDIVLDSVNKRNNNR